MLFPKRPFSKFKTASFLGKKLKKDFSFRSGKIIGSMCSVPPVYAGRLFRKYIGKNLGDPGLCPGTAEIEQEAIQMLGSLLGNSRAAGVFTTGGTEANFLALLTAKKRSEASRREIILSDCAHFSFFKAAEMMDLHPILIPHNEDYSINIEAAAAKISDKTMALIGIAGTTGTGSIDDIPALAALARKHGLYFHVDAAFGGFVLPFLEKAGYPTKPFDFSVEGVCSVTIDPHKMGRGITPGGCILYRDRELADSAAFDVSYLAGGKTRHYTLVGTRSGAAVLANWAQMVRLGEKGYTETVRKCMRLTLFLAGELEEIDGIRCIKHPEINVVAFRSTRIPPERLNEKLRADGWAVSLFGDYFRIVVMPHVTARTIRRFLKDLKRMTGETHE